MYPFAQRCFAVSVTFVQIEIAVWVIKLAGLLTLFAERSFHNAQSPVTESAAGGGVVCFLTVQDEILEEVFLVYGVCTFFIRIPGKNLPVFMRELFYCFFVPRVVGDGFVIGFG